MNVPSSFGALMRKRALYATVGSLAMVPMLVLTSACGAGGSSTLNSVKSGKTVYVDVWKDCGKAGDRAELERNAKGTWVIDRNASVSRHKDSSHQVKVKRTRSGVTVLNLGNAKVGTDSDRSVDSDQLKATMKVKPVHWESRWDRAGVNCHGTKAKAPRTTTTSTAKPFTNTSTTKKPAAKSTSTPKPTATKR